MFTALVFKEWREKALVFFFELGILGLLLAAPLVLRAKTEVREWLIYLVLLLFFPFAALILGASGFEAEYKQGAWAYLFSRPVGRPVIWLAKFSALLSMLAALWLVFFVARAVLPPVRELAWLRGFLLPLDFGTGLPWWSLGLSPFLLAVAFSLSLLHEKQFYILFAALILGLLFPAAAWSVLISRTGGYMAWFLPGKAIRTFIVGLGLIALAFVAASLLTLARSDFSQPRKRLRTFAISLGVLLVLAAAGTVGSATLIPMPGERGVGFVGSSGGKAVYSTERGMFSYDSASGRVHRLTKCRSQDYWTSLSISGRKLAYSALDIKGPRESSEEIWVVNTDGTGRKHLVGDDTPGAWPPEDSIEDLTISPDGQMIAILIESVSERRKNRTWSTATLWTVNTDGSGLEKRSLEALFPKGPEEGVGLSFVTWTREGNALVIIKRSSSPPVRWSLWAYDLERRTASKVRDNAIPASRWWSQNSTLRDVLAIRYRFGDHEPRTLSLLNLATGEETEVARGEESSPFLAQWDPTDEKLLFFDKRTDPEGRGRYILTIYSIAAGKAVAERTITELRGSFYDITMAWMPDGRSVLALVSKGRYLRVLGPDLQDVGRIDLPAKIKDPRYLVVVGAQVLLEDNHTESLWRYDLVKKRWKRLY
ncbi:MAG: ABC transporter permease subunit [Candidatus Aminicenantes bacterium]|nr:ABC transporter permease subunit [Candidatus Aminicenantes bacterium]